MSANIKEISSRHSRMKTARSAFDQDWNSIRDFVRPITVSFNQATGTYSSIRPETMFDGTAPDSLEELASALHSYLTSPTERWFELQLEGVDAHDLSPEELQWLDAATNSIYASYQREDCNLQASLHEIYLDLGSYGTAVLGQEWDVDTKGLIFTAHPLGSCYIYENAKGRVDTVFRSLSWTLRQLKQEFGLLPPKLMKETNLDKPFEVLHCVFPREEISFGMSGLRKPYASVWVCVSTQEILKESGFNSFCYHVPRWTKLAGEFYGRSPARKCLPDIKMLNAMEKTLLKAGQKQVDPPLVLANEGFLLPIKTSPGSLIFKEDEERQITPLEFKGNLPWGEDKANQKRDQIRRAFYNDWIRREKKTREQSATEITDDRDEMLRLFAPIFGRLVMELHGPMIARSYSLLDERGLIPDAPSSMNGRSLKIGYMSAASRAQTGSRANQISRYFQDLVPLAQIDPSVMDAIDLDKAAAELALARGTPRSILRDPADVKVMREGKAKMAAMQQAAQVAEPASKAIKNLSDAGMGGGTM